MAACCAEGQVHRNAKVWKQFSHRANPAEHTLSRARDSNYGQHVLQCAAIPASECCNPRASLGGRARRLASPRSWGKSAGASAGWLSSLRRTAQEAEIAQRCRASEAFFFAIQCHRAPGGGAIRLQPGDCVKLRHELSVRSVACGLYDSGGCIAQLVVHSNVAPMTD